MALSEPVASLRIVKKPGLGRLQSSEGSDENPFTSSLGDLALCAHPAGTQRDMPT